MSLLGRIARLGRSIVSWGLGGPGDGAPQPILIPCPEITFAAPTHVRASITPEEQAEAPLAAPTHAIVRLTPEC